MAWQPIGTLPKDVDRYDEFDVWTARGFRIPDCWEGTTTYAKERGIVYQADYNCDGPVNELVKDATHWIRVDPPK